MGMDAAIALALDSVAEEIETDELAGALLKSKSERLLCDAVAARLEALLADRAGTQVTREWGRGVRVLGRRRIDLAVLCGDKPVALIEAKVAKSFDLVIDTARRYPSGEVRTDIEKLRMVDLEAKRYVLLLVTHNHQTPESRHDAVVSYSDALRRHGVIDDRSIDSGFERFREAVGNVAVCRRGRVPAGKAFGVEVSLLYWLMAVP